jgi:hypothetical protein
VTLLKFQTPTDIPAHQDRDFNIYSAEISLLAKDMRDFCTTHLENYQRNDSHFPKSWHGHTIAQRTAELRTLLDEAIHNGTDVTFNERDHAWWLVSTLILEKRFVSVHCSECNAIFTAGECEVRKWAFDPIGDPTEFNGHGGRRVLCPAEHTLYASSEWIT